MLFIVTFMKQDIGKLIKDARKALGITQAEFAKLLGKGRTTITEYERGQIVPPGDILLKIQELENNIPDEKAA